jgi:hypothetical protein
LNDHGRPVGGGVAEATFSVTGSDTGLFETAEEVNVTVPR